MKKLVVSALLLLSLSTVVLADEAAERARGRELVAGLRGVDERLLGTQHFAHDHDGKTIGQETVTVERAPADSGAVYRVTIVGENAVEGIGGDKSRSETLLDERLALVSLTSELERDVSMMGKDMSTRMSTRLRRDGKAWVQETVVKGERTVTRFETESPDYSQEASMLLLCRKLDRARAATVRLPWVYFGTGEDDPSCVEDITFVVPAAATYSHRGADVQAHLVKVEAVLKQTLVVAADGALLGHWVGFDRPLAGRLVAAASAEEAAQDLEAEDTSDDAAAAKQAAITWFEVTAGEKPFEALDEVVDWTALRDQEAERRREVAELTIDAYKARTREKTTKMRELMGSLLKDMLKMARGGRARIDGDTATVTVMGDDAFTLRKADGRWRIVRLPSRS